MEDEIEAFNATEKVTGVVQCNNCDYWDAMTGYIDPAKPKIIQFVCPKCKCIEKVKNMWEQ